MLAFRLGYSPYPTCGQDLRAVDRMMVEWLPSFSWGHSTLQGCPHGTAQPCSSAGTARNSRAKGHL